MTRKKKRKYKDVEGNVEATRRCINLPSTYSPNSFFERQKKQFCMVNAFNNLYGVSILSTDHISLMQQNIDNIYWIRWRKKEVENYAQNNPGVSKKQLQAYETNLLNGNSNGNWSSVFAYGW